MTTTTTPSPADPVRLNCSPSPAFTDDFSTGELDEKWLVFRKKWGNGNNGLAPSLVSFVSDVVEPNQPARTVLSLGAVGDIADPTVRGFDKVSGKYVEQAVPATRVGSGICTVAEYASGVYNVLMKVAPNSAGMAPSIWTFHYEEHNADETKSSDDVNVNDLLYRWRAKVNGGGYFYSTVNSEVDWPELGHSGQFAQGLYTTYVSEREYLTSTFDMPKLRSLNDGKYHVYTLEWRTELRPSTCSVALPHNGLAGQLYCAEAAHEHQGFPLLQRADGGYDVYAGKSLRYLVDGVEVGSHTAANAPISAIAARLCIAAWLPNWAGPAPWQRSEVRVAEVSAKPLYDDGDICWQPETYPFDGLVKL